MPIIPTNITRATQHNLQLLLARSTIALRAIVARQSTRQFTQRDTHNQNV